MLQESNNIIKILNEWNCVHDNGTLWSLSPLVLHSWNALTLWGRMIPWKFSVWLLSEYKQFVCGPISVAQPFSPKLVVKSAAVLSHIDTI